MKELNLYEMINVCGGTDRCDCYMELNCRGENFISSWGTPISKDECEESCCLGEKSYMYNDECFKIN